VAISTMTSLVGSRPVISRSIQTSIRAILRSAAVLDVPLRRLDPDLPLPSYAHPGDAGADLLAAVDVRLEPGERALVPTGIAIALPEGYVALVHPRSGLAARFGVSIVNAPGTVDAGYRGEIKVLLVNLDPREPVHLARGDRIAQLVLQRVEQARFVEVEVLPGSARGDGGYGSTGGFAARPSTVAGPTGPSTGPSPGTGPRINEERH
jgi:dUTP pyrophosphatase